jgi:predicted GNAT superfamily acetyltransferase
VSRSGPRDTHQVPVPASRYEIRTVSGADADQALDLAESVWGERPLNDAVLRALELAGSYVAVAVDEAGQQVGMCLGIVGVHADHLHLHSHLAAVDPVHRGSGIGRALKRHQREWCLARGIATISWTFDPLIHANARFNLHHLGARGERYLVELYGLMDDDINRGDASDRLLIRWDLEDDRTVAALERPLPTPTDLDHADIALADDGGRPRRADTDAEARLIATPADAVALRRDDPDLARAWRVAVRETMQQAFADGLVPVAVTAHRSYLFALPEDR